MKETTRPERRIVYIEHARFVMQEREIRTEWVERVLSSPEIADRDPFSSHRRRAYGRIREFGDRWLRVVYEIDGDITTIVTAFFDRNAGRRA